MIQKEQSEQQVLLVEQNKLASMGEMISSIAHQWRQPLTEINGVVLNMDMDYRKKQLTAERFDKHLNDIENVTSYLSKTIHDFMNLFSHKKELEIFYISDVIRSSKRLSHISLNEEITFIYDSERDFQLCGYMSELTQALLIVFHNAVDASKERGLSPVVTIDVESSSSLLYINIKDNGGGISEDILKDIFNPYFTTKHESQGTGLGLYILKMIIEESMHGSVKIVNYSQGSHCEIIIPLNLKQKRVN
jgi:signal transduction histidine kinase